MPKVSIITPAYNSSRFIKEAIESVLGQSYQDFEMIVVDDGSTDGTSAIVKEYQIRFPLKVRYLYQDNAGPSRARNTAIKEANGEYLALLDADDVWFPRRLEQGVGILDADPEIGLVHANIDGIIDASKPVKIFRRDTQYLSGLIFEHLFLRKADIASSTVIFRKVCCQEVGIFDENLSHFGSEDRDLWLRISQKFEIHYIDQTLAHYRIRPESMSHDYDNMLNGRLYIVEKFSKLGRLPNSLRAQALAKIYRDLGDIHLLKKDFIQAKEYFEKSLTFRPWSVWTWVNLTKTQFKF